MYNPYNVVQQFEKALSQYTGGEYAAVGAGSVVTKDVPPRTLVAGNPAKIIRKLKTINNKWE